MRYPIIITNEENINDEKYVPEIVAVIMLEDIETECGPIVEAFNDHIKKWNQKVKVDRIAVEKNRAKMNQEDWKEYHAERRKRLKEHWKMVKDDMRPMGCEVYWLFDVHDGVGVKYG